MSRLLVKLRGDRRQADTAGLAGLKQTKISRAESGKFPLSPADAETYARACGASEEDVQRLVKLAGAFAESNITTRSALVRSARTIQERVGRLERESTLIRSWQPEIVPGVLQIPPYTAAVIGVDPGPEWLLIRQARLAMVTEPHRTWHQLISEAALRWALGSNEIMAQQIEHLVSLSRLPNIRLGIVPFGVVHPVPPPSAFHLYGSRVACAATETATAFLNDAHDVTHYEGLFGELDAIALFDDEARGLLQRIEQDYRSSR